MLMEHVLFFYAEQVYELNLGGLREVAACYEDKVQEIREQSLMIGIEFQNDKVSYALLKGMFDEGIVAGTLVNSKIIRIEPPLTISKEEVGIVIAMFKRVLGIL